MSVSTDIPPPLSRPSSPVCLVRAIRAVYAALHGALSAVGSVLALTALLLRRRGVSRTGSTSIGAVATSLQVLAVALGTRTARRSTIHAIARGSSVARWHTLGAAVVALLLGLVLLRSRLLLVGPQLLVLLDGRSVAC